MIILSFN